MALAVLVPASPAQAADLPGGGYVYVAQTDNQVVALVRGTSTVAGTVTVPRVTTSPLADMVTGPGGTAAYLLTGPSVTIIDTRSLTVLGSLLDPSGNALEGFALSPDGSRVYALTADRHVDVFDVSARSLLGRVAVTGSSTGAARQIVADNAAAYVLAGPGLAVVPKTGTPVTTSIPVAGGGTSAAIYPPTGRIYVTQPAAGDQSALAVVDIASGTVVNTFGVFDPIGSSAPGISPDGQMIYVGGAIEGLFLQRIETLGGGNLSSAAFRAPLGIPVVTPDNVTVYAAARGTTDLLAVTDWQLGDVIPIPGNPVAVTMVDLTTVPGAPTVTSLSNGAGRVTVGFTPVRPARTPRRPTLSRRPTSPHPSAAARPPPGPAAR